MYTKGECAFIGCGATAKFIFETLESAADRGYGVIVEPVGPEDSRAFNLYQVTPARAKAAPNMYELLNEVRQNGLGYCSIEWWNRVLQVLAKADGKEVIEANKKD